MTNVTELPQHLDLDLDAEQRPASEVKPPFAVNVAGRRLVMLDPADLDWRDLLLLDTPTDFLRLALSSEDRKFLMEQELPGWKFNKLMESYYAHYDLDEKVRTARRQQQLSGI